ncbi:MAG: alpha/beta fold hydrolase [Acidobacteriota bacterium]
MILNYRSYGRGSTLIILHGLLGSLDNWHTLSKSFAESFQVLTLDQRNHGQSPHHNEFNYQVMAKDLREFMQLQGLGQAHLLGHSMGGKTAMRFALDYPDMVDRLIVIDIAPKAYPPQHNEIFAALYALDLKTFHNRKEIDMALATGIPDFAIRQFLLKNISYNEATGFKWKMNLDAIYKNYEKINEAIKADHKFTHPTLFIRGGNSHYIEVADEALIKTIFPAAVIATVKGVGHWVHAEAPQELAKLVLDFLK